MGPDHLHTQDFYIHGIIYMSTNTLIYEVGSLPLCGIAHRSLNKRTDVCQNRSWKWGPKRQIKCNGFS